MRMIAEEITYPIVFTINNRSKCTVTSMLSIKPMDLCIAIKNYIRAEITFCRLFYGCVLIKLSALKRRIITKLALFYHHLTIEFRQRRICCRRRRTQRNAESIRRSTIGGRLLPSARRTTTYNKRYSTRSFPSINTVEKGNCQSGMNEFLHLVVTDDNT